MVAFSLWVANQWTLAVYEGPRWHAIAVWLGIATVYGFIYSDYQQRKPSPPDQSQLAAWK